jgi:thymidylate kinase
MIIIFEGPDRTGKDTQIQLLQSHFVKVDHMFHVLHYSGFKGVTNKKAFQFSKAYYQSMFEMLNHLDCYYNLILNRSHLGEYVYGQMYRGYSGNYVFNIEKDFMDMMADMYLFVFFDKPENLIKRDDDNSFTTDIAKKTEEIERFQEAFKKSHIKNKYLIEIEGQSPEDIHEFIVTKVGL